MIFFTHGLHGEKVVVFRVGEVGLQVGAGFVELGQRIAAKFAASLVDLALDFLDGRFGARDRQRGGVELTTGFDFGTLEPQHFHRRYGALRVAFLCPPARAQAHDYLHQRRLQQPLSFRGGAGNGSGEAEGGDSVPLRYVPGQCGGSEAISSFTQVEGPGGGVSGAGARQAVCVFESVRIPYAEPAKQNRTRRGQRYVLLGQDHGSRQAGRRHP